MIILYERKAQYYFIWIQTDQFIEGKSHIYVDDSFARSIHMYISYN